MKRISIFLSSISLLTASLSVAAADKVEICHYTQGEAAPRILTVDSQAAEQHIQNHGDHMGACLFGSGTPSSTVYVTDFSDNEVFVLNAETNTQIATLSTNKTPIRTTRSPNQEFVYITNLNSNNVTVVSTSDNTIIGTVGVGKGPQNVVFSPDSAMAYVYNVKAGSVSVVRTADHTLVDTVVVGNGNPIATYNNLAISPNGEFVYVPNTNDNTVSVIETAGNTVHATVPVGTNPLSVAVTPDSQYVYVVNAGSPVSVIQTSDHTVIKQVGKASIAQQSLAITPDGQFVYTIGNSDIVQVISTATISVVANITMSEVNFATDIVISPDSNYVYIPAAQTSLGNGRVIVFDATTHSIVASIEIGGTPKYAAVSPDGSTVYIANFNTVDVIQTSDNTLVTKVNTGGDNAYSIAVVGIP